MISTCEITNNNFIIRLYFFTVIDSITHEDHTNHVTSLEKLEKNEKNSC